MDNEFTQRITDWLNTPRNERDITAGANMLLQLNRNRFLHANILRRPQQLHDKLEYELRKHLQIRLDGRTLRDVVVMEQKIMPAAKSTLAATPVVSTDSELPQGTKALGRRPDHDKLPDYIQALWDDNLQRYKTIKLLFEKLKTMEHDQPCDRYEYLKLLDDADKTYRKNLEQYDSFDAATAATTAQSAAPAPSAQELAEQRRRTAVARKSLSKWKAVLADALAKGDTERANLATDKVNAYVDTIRRNGHSVGKAVAEELKKLGIDISQ